MKWRICIRKEIRPTLSSISNSFTRNNFHIFPGNLNSFIYNLSSDHRKILAELLNLQMNEKKTVSQNYIEERFGYYSPTKLRLQIIVASITL